jgi:Inorganic Pyrophosphatase
MKLIELLEGRAIVNRMSILDLQISIEVNAGEKRTGTSKDGTKWEQVVSASYGYILGTNSPDGEHLDVWVRKNPVQNCKIYVIHQLSVDGSKYDEDKVMLGYSNKTQAIAEFKKNCFKPNLMFGGCSEFDIEHFKVIAFSARNSKVMIASQDTYDSFEKKGLIPKGIKSPIELSKIVKESTAEQNKRYRTRIKGDMDKAVDAVLVDLTNVDNPIRLVKIIARKFGVKAKDLYNIVASKSNLEPIEVNKYQHPKGQENIEPYVPLKKITKNP